MDAETDFAGDLHQRFGAHQRGMPARELALALLRKAAQQQVGHGEGQHAVAQELQSFVAVRKGRLEFGPAVKRAAMG